MQKYYVSFVVLHYQETEITKCCIESIKKLDDSVCNIEIIVVDNASPNGSGKKLEEIYSHDPMVTCILSDKNNGFARGNNLGFDLAKKNGADFIVLINNDTTIEQKNFCENIRSIYNKTGFAVLGPDILSVKDGIHQNPTKGFPLTKREVMKRILKIRLILCALDLGLGNICLKLRKKNANYNNDFSEPMLVGDNSDYVLHGSCLIFSEKYIEKFDGLHPGTFMYLEENILACICKKYNLKMVYSPEIHINHFRNISTNNSYKNNKEKMRFFYSNLIKSLYVLKGII